MAANVVKPGRNENVVVTKPTPKVTEITKEWSVIEDGALAHQLQEEENSTHYSGNISRRRTVRSDIRTAKSAADEEALQAFKEEHDIAQKNREMEMEDSKAAKRLLEEMMEEEKQKIREQRQQVSEKRDQEAAKELYHQMMEEEQRKHRQQRSFQESDEELALRIQAHEEKKQRILSQRHHSMDQQEMESERLARHLAREEKMRSQSQRERVYYDPKDDGIRHHQHKRDDKHSESRVHREGPKPNDPTERRHDRRQAEPQQTDRQRLPESSGQTGTPTKPTDPWEYLYKPRQKEETKKRRSIRTERGDAEMRGRVEPQQTESQRLPESSGRTGTPTCPTDPWENLYKPRQKEQTKEKRTERTERRDAEMPLEPPERRKKQQSPERREQTSRPRATHSLESQDKPRHSERTERRDTQRPTEPVQQTPLEPPERRKKHRAPEGEPREHKDRHGEKDYLMPNVAGLRVAVGEETVAELPARKHKPQGVPRQHSAPAYVYDGFPHQDSDEETDVIAKIQNDEQQNAAKGGTQKELARRLQKEEIQKSRAPPQLTEQQRKQLIHDQKIAIKMQHEEVMFSKKSTYDNYMERVKDEIADPEPMVHVSRQNKTAVTADAKYAAGVQLTDYTAAEVAQQRRTSGSGHGPGVGPDGNILATIDPTFNQPGQGNVVLLKNSPLNEEPTPTQADDGSLNPVQGSKRKESKDKGKRASIFSKLKKK